MRRAFAALLVAACSTEGEDAPVTLRFTPDPVGEQYLCFGFSIAPLAGADLGAISLRQLAGPITLHHVSLFASPTPFAAGPSECLAMPDEAVPMNVWAPGGGDLVLADDVALVIPDGTTHLIVQTHALRTGDGEATERELTLMRRRDATHRAGWLPLRAPTPALRPLHREESRASCIVDVELHVVSTWPHMHRYGIEFHGLVDVVPWSFDEQRAHPIDVTIASGGAIDTHCVWQNTTDQTVLPGPSIDDEMCGQSLIAYPVLAARCR